MSKYLSKCKIPVEVYEYDSDAPDDLFNLFASKWQLIPSENIKDATGLKRNRIQIIDNALKDENIQSMISLISLKGIGLKTMEKCFSFVMSDNNLNKSMW